MRAIFSILLAMIVTLVIVFTLGLAAPVVAEIYDGLKSKNR
jgi:hypothetical protein